MDLYIKQLVETFDFNSIKKQNKTVNAIDMILKYIILKINNREKLSQDDYDLLKNCVGIYKVAERKELQELIKYFMKQFDNECNLNWIDVSNVTDMNNMFFWSRFNGDISQWNVSNVISMASMFSGSKFNGDISQWNVSNVTTMYEMFKNSHFNGDISQWDVSNVKNTMAMFSNSDFNGDISQWNVSNVTSMAGMFSSSLFNNDISQWNVSKVIDMHICFISLHLMEI